MDNQQEGRADGQGEAQSARRAKVRGGQSQDHANCKAGANVKSGWAECQLERVDRTSRARAAELIGGILARILEDKQQRVREAQQWVAWHENELIKREAELADFQQFMLQIQRNETE